MTNLKPRYYAQARTGRWITSTGTSSSIQDAKEFRSLAAAERAMRNAIRNSWADEATGIYTIDWSGAAPMWYRN